MDLTTLWVLMRTYRGLIIQIVMGAVLFAAGWQLGRVMSPYYAAHPIVFTESATVAHSGNAAALTALQGLPTGQAAGSPAVAGASEASSAPQASPAPTAPVTAATFIASKNSDKYHHKDCPSWKQIKEENRIFFTTPEEAEKAGYVPAACTRTRLGI